METNDRHQKPENNEMWYNYQQGILIENAKKFIKDYKYKDSDKEIMHRVVVQMAEKNHNLLMEEYPQLMDMDKQEDNTLSISILIVLIIFLIANIILILHFRKKMHSCLQRLEEVSN